MIKQKSYPQKTNPADIVSNGIKKVEFGLLCPGYFLPKGTRYQAGFQLFEALWSFQW